MFDRTTGTYLTTDSYPKLWIDGRGGSNGDSTGLTQPLGDKIGWWLDPSHEPGMSYLALLLTGLHYRLDQLNAQATWTVLAVWPPPRQNGLGIVAAAGEQLRGAAWGLRELVEAAYVNPDMAPLKVYFERLVANNFTYLLAEAKAAHQGEVYGWLRGGYPYGAMAPWQQDFMAFTAMLAAEQDVRGAKELLAWQAHFLAGRFLAGDKGLSPYDGIAYNMDLWKDSPDKPFLTWREVGDFVVANHWSGGGAGWPQGTGAYYLAAKGALAGIVTVTGMPEAKQALEWLSAHPGSHGESWPQWNIVQ